MNFSQLPAQIPDGIFSGSIYALFALGYALVFAALFLVLLMRPQELFGRGVARSC
jgi:branched-subunit amino acid ABC-type transport system permease component